MILDNSQAGVWKRARAQGRGETIKAGGLDLVCFADWLPTGSTILPKIVRNLNKK